MRSNSLLVLACLVSVPAFAQSLPDEINWSPYESRYLNFSQQVTQTQSELSEARKNLQEAQSFIQAITRYLAQLEEEIRATQSLISEHQREIPYLEGQASSTRNEMSRAQSQLQSLRSKENDLKNRYNQEHARLRPLEDAVSRKQQRLRQLQSELSQHQRLEREAASRVSQARTQINSLDKQIEQQRNLQRQLRAELNSIGSRISQHESQISQAQSKVSTLTSNLNKEKQKLTSLDQRVRDTQAEVNRLRSAGAPASEIQAAERKLASVKNTRNNTANEIKTLETQISRTQQEIRTHQSRVSELRRDQLSLPSKISNAENKERQLVQQKSKDQSYLSRYQQELTQAQRNVAVREQAIAGAHQDIRQEEMNLDRQRQVVNSISRTLDDARRDVTQAQNHLDNLTQQERNLTSRIQQLKNEIPRLQAEIRQFQNDIVTGNRELDSARSDERKFTASIQTLEIRLSALIADRDEAQRAFDQRRSLYNYHLSAAKNLGSGQASSATALGEKEGARLSTERAQHLGMSIGKEFGSAQAQYWGFVRGEVQGHSAGLQEGLASQEDQRNGDIAGTEAGKAEAHVYAQTYDRPNYFEEMVLAEFKRPVEKMAALKSLRPMHILPLFNEFLQAESVPSLTQAEIEASQSLVTLLDEKILGLQKGVDLVADKAARMGKPAASYQAPTQIPYGKFDCAAVYKSIAEFKRACESSYRSAFINLYQAASKDTYYKEYSDQYERELMNTQLSTREAAYANFYNEAHAVAHAQGLKEGKAEIYQQSFKRAHSLAYKSEMPLAQAQAKADAAQELQEHLTKQALLTLAESRLAADYFRGGEEVSIQAEVKNVSHVAFQGAAVIRIDSVENGEVLLQEAVLTHAQGRSQTKLPELKVRVASSARTGDLLRIKGTAELPGDVYKVQRVEKFELVQALSANPAHSLDLDYDRTPKVKGLFSRYVHRFTSTLAPNIEDIKEGYSVSLSAVGANAPLMEIKEGAQTTGALQKGQEKKIDFNYIFKDAAKGKKVELELTVSYLDRIIKREKVELSPR